MDFDFLPKLPKSNLDDRTFHDLVEECILRIPRYCPEWTNHNPSDPGITLIELFAWLTDQMLLRFNQVPRRNYVTFLELLGIQLLPPSPARCELTFYLTKAQPFRISIPTHTEVATVRTETEEAIIFTTDRELVIGNPQIKHFLSADIEENIHMLREEGFAPTLRDRTPPNSRWENMEETRLFEQSIPGNCFYLVIEDPEHSIEGNVLAVNFRGEAARSTGIDPNNPPIKWEAWNGNEWQSVLRAREEDKTKGFSFSELGQQSPNPLREGADVILHIPQEWPEHDFGITGTNYRGHWLRCVYTQPNELQPSYSSSPTIVGVSVRAIGGAVNASECVRIQDELLGVSNGKAGQTFNLQGKPLLERQREMEEFIQVKPPGGEIETWTEVADFSDSSSEDLHYTINSVNGIVQFGPLIREPAQLKWQTQQRAQIQPGGRIFSQGNGDLRNLPALPSAVGAENEFLERQYGKVPPLGAEVSMVSYRTGGGSRGNVEAQKLTFVKSSIPYVKSVINYNAARGGNNAESLDEAVIRVPHELRTRESAVTPEDFENVAKKASRSVARAHYLKKDNTPGIVRLLIVPISTDTFESRRGINPDSFALRSRLEIEIQNYMQDRKPLGVHVKLLEPEYIGVSVRIEVMLDNPRAQENIRSQLLDTLYRFLNPVTGGIEGEGWPLGRPVYLSDIISLCQKIPGVRHLGIVELFGVRKYTQGWQRADISESVIDPGPIGLVCSWADEDQALETGHQIDFIY